MNQSIYTRTDTETPRGIVRLKAGGFRYNTSTMRMEVVFRGLVNSWGHCLDDSAIISDRCMLAPVESPIRFRAWHLILHRVQDGSRA